MFQTRSNGARSAQLLSSAEGEGGGGVLATLIDHFCLKPAATSWLPISKAAMNIAKGWRRDRVGLKPIRFEQEHGSIQEL
jgi:hypothetical protein